MASEIATCLSSTLSSDPNVRIAAELKLSELSAYPEAAATLSQLVLAQDIDLTLRQSASIVLRKYVKERWSPIFAQFRGPAPPVEIKAQIRQVVFQGLSDPIRKIRSLSAHTLSSIANADWPDEYPELLTQLIQLLSSNSPDAVHGAMQVFVEFVKSDLTEDQILPVLRELLPVLHNILGDTTKHNPLTRARTISVFRQCVEALYMVKDQHPQAVKEATATVLPYWLDAFKVLLSIDPSIDVTAQGWEGLAIRIQVFKTLSTIHTSFPRALAPYLPTFLQLSLQHLSSLLPTFTAYYLSPNSTVSPPKSSEDETIELTHLVCPLLDFMGAALRSGKVRDWLLESGERLAEIIGRVVEWVQMTTDDEEEWATDPNAFVAQDSDETLSYSVRVAGFDLLAILLERYPAQTASAIGSIINKFVQESSEAREAGNEIWWKPLEAALASLGSLSEGVLECLDDEEIAGRPKPIDIEWLLGNVIPELLRLGDFSFLQGRAFVFSSQYAKLLPLNLADQYLAAAVQVLEAEGVSVPVKLSAVKAIHNFSTTLTDGVLLNVAPRVARDLGPFLLQTTEDTLTLVLETLSVVVEIEKAKWLDVDLASNLVGAVLEVWAKFNKDPIFISILSDILQSITASPAPGIYQVVVQKSLGTLSQAIGNTPKQESWIASAGIELVSAIVEGAPASENGGLGEGFFGQIGQSLFKCLRETEDRDVIQNGINLLTLIIRKDLSQLSSFVDPTTSQSGLDSALAVIAKQLQSEEESGGLGIGELIIHLLRRAPGEVILPVLPELLKALVGRMESAKTASFIQSLVIPFAFLIHNGQRDTVLSLLSSTTIPSSSSPTGTRSGLDVLIQTWCENAETFQGFWAIRISNLALCSLFAAAGEGAGDVLKSIIVKGDLIVREETKNVIMTRSRTKKIPTEFTRIPFPVKTVKILLHDLQSNGESAAMGLGATEELDSDDGDEEWQDDEKLVQGFKQDELAFLSDMLGPRGAPFDNDEALDTFDDDEDLRADPVSQIDMKAHLINFFKECSARNTAHFNGLVEQLTADEMVVMKTALSTQ
ncbi:ARM repeat-containing protein [Abortiporus biennis]|nr:ARM repeat-containing protein [Abortiporus biennis]